MEQEHYNSKYNMVFNAGCQVTNFFDDKIYIAGDLVTTSAKEQALKALDNAKVFNDRLREACKKISNSSSLRYSALYFYLRQNKMIEEKNATEFGKWLQKRTEISYETVRKSGNFTTLEKRDEEAFNTFKRIFEPEKA